MVTSEFWRIHSSKRIIGLITISMMISSALFARIGIGETFFETPGGHLICDCDPYNTTPVLVGYEDKIHGLEKWYFYRSHVIGKGQDYFFIFNEHTEELMYFEDQNSWKASIKHYNLDPFFTRWLDMSDSPSDFLFSLKLYGYILAIPISIIVVIVGILSIIGKIRWTKYLILSVVISLVALSLFITYNLTTHSL